MNWFHFRSRREEGRSEQIASAIYPQAEFHDLEDYLWWIALLITGDAALARQSVLCATTVSTEGVGVFRDWLIRWATSATAREAIRLVRDAIAKSAKHYHDWPCIHTEHNILSDEQIYSLHELDAKIVVAALDPFARSSLVLRGIQGVSFSECALSIDVPRGYVMGAYCYALDWFSEQIKEKES